MNASPKENKHVACSRCRERKVKCDGAKPTCKRCHRHGQSCQYTSGKKPQAKSQWTRHLRTFSAAPDKADESIARPHISQPSGLMSTNDGSDFIYDNMTTSARSPSPYYNGLENRPGSSWSTTSYGYRGPHDSGNEWLSGSIPTSASVTEAGFAHSNAYNFNQGTSFCNTNYISSGLSTYPNQTFGSTTSMRSTTPTSQASGTPSFEGSFVPDFSYTTVSQPAVSADDIPWNPYCQVPFTGSDSYTSNFKS